MIRLLTAAAGLCVALWLLALLLRPDVRPRPFAHTVEQQNAAVAGRDVAFDPNHTPSLVLHEHVRPTGESPLLTELVKIGKLPPLTERLPDNPVVMTGKDGIGQYGGTWLNLAVSTEDIGIVSWRNSGPFLVRWSPLGYPIEPHIAESVVPSDDTRVWTATLRRGLKWSDGRPFTADDILYWWECEATNKYIAAAVPPWMMRQGKAGRIEKVDREHVRFVFDTPYPLFLETLAQQYPICDTCEHYLRRYHPDPAIGDKDLIAQGMKTYKMPSARALYFYMKEWANPQCPRMWPWVYRTYKGDPPQVFVRNPYYFVVDTAGNQLPYLDRMQFDVQDAKLVAVNAAGGAASMQARNLRFSDYTELVSRSDSAGTRVAHWYPTVRSTWVINPNLNRRVDPARPETKWKADLLADKHFRQALSLAIDRRKIITAVQSGVGEPSQIEPGPQSVFHNESLAKAFVDYDPARANAMLDALGLTRRDGEGYRTFADGTRMTWYLETSAFSGSGPAQFVIDNWAAVGVRCVLRELARTLFYVDKDAMEFDFNAWTGESDYDPLTSARYLIPQSTESFYAVGWARWYSRGGFYGNPDANSVGCIPVPESSPMHEAIDCYEKALSTTDKAEREKLVRRVTDIAAENTWSISIATPPPVPVVVDKDLRNVPDNALYGSTYATPSNAGMETYYFAHPHDSEGAKAGVMASIVTPTLRVEAANAAASWLTVLVRLLVVGVPLLLLIALAVRHPFIGRRLLIMVPTLAVISLLVFVMIRLPPGDFLTSKLMQVQESGDRTAEQQISDLRELFHFDQPAWKLYTRWLGLNWFFTYSAADEGLLQGNLGRSMETSQPINAMVGDRILLTVVVSLVTVLFTWAMALPIGIYSAVRQYSLGDYVLTLVGFVGMCVPAFLLALVLIAVSGMSGLFSPEFARQPEWTAAKTWDLLKHIWIPVVVLGVGGTAAMIRTMRANLLDELKKPYVTTAMAKGVRPMRLLLKYPVRLALNPFVSSIGGLFPQLISGGAIVSLVMALPMIGPLQLQALQNQDTYLAGSMLMVLSLLSVVGTLISDLLLLWLDPRIRLE